jgi:DNA-binding NarL/FixJ family response regulator
MIRVLVVDDQTLVREGFALLLSRHAGIEIVATAGNGAEAIQAAARLRPDVVLMDLRMPGVDGVEATRRIRAHHPQIAVLILTTYLDDATVLPALRAGASGVLGKDASPQQVLDAITDVLADRPVIPATTQAALLADLHGVTTPPGSGLSPRETEVVRLLAEGLRNDDIALRLAIAPVTVKTHINNLFAKTGARTRRDAVTYAATHGLLGPHTSRPATPTPSADHDGEARP